VGRGKNQHGTKVQASPRIGPCKKGKGGGRSRAPGKPDKKKNNAKLFGGFRKKNTREKNGGQSGGLLPGKKKKSKKKKKNKPEGRTGKELRSKKREKKREEPLSLNLADLHPQCETNTKSSPKNGQQIATQKVEATQNRKKVNHFTSASNYRTPMKPKKTDLLKKNRGPRTTKIKTFPLTSYIRIRKKNDEHQRMTRRSQKKKQKRQTKEHRLRQLVRVVGTAAEGGAKKRGLL